MIAKQTATVLLILVVVAFVGYSWCQNQKFFDYVISTDGSGTYFVKDSAGVLKYSTSDYSAAVNSIPSNSAVSITDGTYTMLTPIVYKSGQSFTGQDENAVVITGFRTTSVGTLMTGRGNNILLSKFTFNVNNPNPTGSIPVPNLYGQGIILVGDGNTISHVTLYNAYLQGIIMGDVNTGIVSNNPVVHDCNVYNCGNDAIILDDCQGGLAYNNNVHDSYGDQAGGINICYGSSQCIVKNNFGNNLAYGFGTDNSFGVPDYADSFINNVATNSRYNGFMVDGGTLISFVSCTAVGYGQLGFWAGKNPTTGTYPINAEFAHCVADGNSQNAYGFMATNMNNYTISDFHATGNRVGIEIASSIGPGTLREPVFSNNSAHDIMVITNTQNLTIIRNPANCYIDPTSQPYVKEIIIVK